MAQNYHNNAILGLINIKEILIFFLLFFAFGVQAQNNKYREDSIALLQMQNKILSEKVQRLESDFEKVKNTQSMDVTAIAIMSEKTASLQEQIDRQQSQIVGLLRRCDSLMVLLQGHVSPNVVVNPQNEKDSVKYIVQQYFSATTWKDILPYVLHPERVKKIMEDSKGSYFTSHKAAVAEKKLVTAQHIKEGEVFTVSLENSDLSLYLKKIDGTYKVDWEASNKYNEVNPMEFRSAPNNSTAELRVSISSYEFFWNDYQITKDKYNSFYLYGLGWYVYVDKSMPCAQELSKMLADGKIHKMMLTLKKEARTKSYADGSTYT